MAWFNTDWGFRKSITLKASEVPADQTDFTVLFSSTDSDFSQAQSNGNDFVFTSSDKVTQIPHEIEKFVDSTGELIAWVKVPSLSGSVDTVIYIYYGNASVSNQQDAVNTWDSGFKGVWHLTEDPEGTAPQHLDSTVNNNDGTAEGTMTSADQVTAKINGGIDFDDLDDNIQFPDSVSLSQTAVLTVSFWASQVALSTSKCFVAKWNQALDSSWGIQIDNSSNTSIQVFTASGLTDIGSNGGATVAGVWSIGTFHYVAFVFNGAGSTNADRLKIYFNGVEITPLSFFGTVPSSLPDSSIDVRIGELFSLGRNWDGIIDELHISGSIRDADWILTEYNNQSQNVESTFFEVELQELVSDVVPILSTTGLSTLNLLPSTAQICDLPDSVMKVLIDDILLRLNDDGTLFSRAEILRWLSEACRRFTNQTRHAKTFTALDMPPRYTRAITHDWESNDSSGLGDGYGGTYRKWTFTHQNGQRECTFLWEAQQADGVIPTNTFRAVSQLWELSIGTGQVDAYYRFVLPRNESVIHGVWHDHERLEAVTAKILDTLEDRWWAVEGEPIVYSQTLGDANTFDVYEIESEYIQAYSHVDSSQGSPRGFSGDRTYVIDSKETSWGYAYAWNGEPATPSTGLNSDGSGQLAGPGRRFTFGPVIDVTFSQGGGFFYTHDWEGEMHADATATPSASTAIAETNPIRYDPSIDPPVESTIDIEIGIFRKAISPDRQYWPSGQWQVLGVARKWGSSEDNILVYHSVNCEDILDEDDTIDLIPKQLHKYLAYYALSILFNRQGEGYDPALAQHYQIRANRGVVLLNKLANTTRVNESYVRGSRGDRPKVRTQLPQLPSNFPRAPWLRR